jgi:hypothetical protein
MGTFLNNKIRKILKLFKNLTFEPSFRINQNQPQHKPKTNPSVNLKLKVLIKVGPIKVGIDCEENLIQP